jgi:hypothetical protein
MKITKEYLAEKNIDPDNCSIAWLAGMTEAEWRALPWLEKIPILKEWNRYWPTMRIVARIRKREREEAEETLVKAYDRFKASGGRLNKSANWPWEER